LRRIAHPEGHAGVNVCKIPYASFGEYPFYALG